jgi:hypothetical protein
MNDKPLINPQDDLTISVLAYAINLLDERMAALETQTTPEAEPEFVPGWVAEEDDALYTGTGQNRHEWPIIRLYHEKGTSLTNLMIDSHSEKLLDNNGLRQLIDAALAVYRLMEAEQSK